MRILDIHIVQRQNRIVMLSFSFIIGSTLNAQLYLTSLEHYLIMARFRVVYIFM